MKNILLKIWPIFKRILWYKSVFVRGTLAVLTLLVLLLQSATVQTFLAQQASAKISEILKFPISIERLEIQWLDQIKLKQVRIKDQQQKNMIFVEGLTLNYHLTKLLQNGNIVVEHALLDSANVNLIQYPDSLGGLNIDAFIAAIDNSPADTTKKISKGSQFIIKSIDLQRSFFSYNNSEKEHQKDYQKERSFDVNHFAFNNLQAEVKNFVLVRDTIQLDMKEMRGVESNIRFPIREITTFFRYCKKGIELRGLTARLGNSVLKDTILFRFKKPAEMGDFNNKVRIHARLNKSVIKFKDLAIFAPSLAKYPETLTISGVINGRVSNFKVDSLDARFGRGSHLIGKVFIEGLPNIDESFVDFKLKKSTVNTNDFRIYLGDTDVFRRINKFGAIRFDGEFLGFLYDFVANGKFQTALGYIDSDINFKTDNNYYKGRLLTKKFDLGTFLYANILQQIDMEGTIEGNNFTTETAKFNLKAQISRLGFKNYDYRNIGVNAHFEHKFFKGDLTVKDTNLVLNGSGEINLNDSTFKVKAHLDSALLHKINFSKDLLVLRGDADLDFEGLDLDRLDGIIDIRDAEIHYKKEVLPIQKLFIQSTKLPNGVRDIDFISDYVSFYADGKFNLKQVYNDIQQMAKEYQLHFENSTKALNDYYIAKVPLSTDSYKLLSYQVDYDVTLKDVTPIVRLFVPNFYISPNTTFQGKFSSDSEKYFDIQGEVDSIFYNDFRFYYTDIKLKMHKNEYERDVFLDASVLSQKQKLNGFHTEILGLELDWDNNKIFFDTFIKKQDSNDKADFSGSFNFVGNHKYDLVVKPSKVIALNDEWTNPDTLKIGIDGQNIDLHSIRFVSGKKKLLAIGSLSEDLTKTLQLQLVGFDLDILSDFIGKKVKGVFNGEAILRNVYHTPQVEADFSVSNIYMDSVYWGDLYASSAWEDANQRLSLKAKLKHQTEFITEKWLSKRKQHLDEDGNDTIPLLNLEGYYYTDNKVSPLDLKAKFNEIPVNLIEPFLASIFSDFEGLATGEVGIHGKLASPQLAGNIFVSGGKFRVNYLNTVYHFDDFISLSADHIGMKQLKLLDENGNRAIVNGGVYHDSFRSYIMQMHIDFTKFKVLGTEISSEALYFGSAYGTGSLDILGATDNLQIDIKAKTEKGTKIYLALDGYAGVEEKEFIKFVDFTKDSINVDKKTKVNLSGLKMNFNLELTPDAYGEIIFDKQSGDIISGNTQGKLNMLIDTKGDFAMFGDVEFVRGSYTFTFLNVVSKEFDIKEGSRVSWIGDPFGGQLNVAAIYKTRTSLLPIMSGLDSVAMKSPELRRPYPVRVDLAVTGALLNPEIKFGVDITEYPAMISAGTTAIPMDTHIQAFKAKLLSNEQELNRQVFSLMVLNRLSETEAFVGLSGQSLTSSVSELLSNQLSHWISQVDENLQVDMNLNGLTADALNTFQMRISYSLLNDRVRITRSGGFTSVRNQASATAVIGDWTVEYLITKDAKFRAKAYYKAIANTFNINQNNVGASGIGLSYTHSFGNFKDLLPKLKKVKKQSRDASVIVIPDDEIR
jgi:hypothetical protein